MNDTIRVWTRKELEDAAAVEPEGRTMLRVAVTPRLLLRVIEWTEAQGAERCEVLSAYGNPEACEVRFFRRDPLEVA